MRCPDVTTPMTGRICVVTGANSGIGRVTARRLAELGAHVVLVGRDRVKGEDARAEVERAGRAGGYNGTAALEIADLSVQAEVRALAARLLERHPTIHVLVNNAGVSMQRRELTADGIERTFAVNHLAYFMLALLLLPALRRAPEARIVNVTSEAHQAFRKPEQLDFGNLQGERRYKNLLAYSTSKLGNVAFTLALARRLEEEGAHVTVNTLHPGVVATDIWRQLPVLRSVGKWFMRSPEQGAQTTIYLAASPDVAHVTGEYFVDCRIRPSSAASRDRELQERIWTESERLTHVHYVPAHAG